ncbi:MAG: alanine dehydrogenase [Chloroflexi bacterium]|nr:alanine dehydrogenase [Chloroflexota bacterium]
MIVGVPREIKDHEYRVALTPYEARALVATGQTVLVEMGAGEGSGFPDSAYAAAGAKVVPSAAEVFGQAEMVVKVKEPQPSEYELLCPGTILFTYLHLAPNPSLTTALLNHKVTAIAYETVQLPNGALPLLIPMSQVAGRMATQVGAHYLERASGGSGKLLGGIPGVAPCEVVILGGGVVGINAAFIACGMGARVTVISRTLAELRIVADSLRENVATLASNPQNIAESVKKADLLIGAALVPGARAPRLVTRHMVQTMQPGSVIVDVSIDQGGCIETSRPTTHSDPVYVAEGVVHYCVPNIPGLVPRTSTLALASATMPYVMELARYGFERAIAQDEPLAKGVNTHAGHVTHSAVAEALSLEYVPLREIVQPIGGPA